MSGITRIILIRHCEAAGNVQRIFQGHYDGEVTENGRRQLEQLYHRVKNMDFDVLYSSPLTRAYETAKAVNRGKNYKINIEEGLIEINGGRWEGLKWASFPKLFPEESEAWLQRPWDFHPKDGESMRSVYNRMWDTVLKLVRENMGGNICAVSHGCAIRNLLCRAKGMGIDKLNEIRWGDNTAISIIDFDENLSPQIIIESDSSHLNDETSTMGKQNWWKEENVGKLAFE